MSGLPWDKFFWSDYASDPPLKICSLAAQGLWMRMLCIAAEHEPKGYVAVNGEGLGSDEIAALVGQRIDVVEPLLAELERRGVFNRDRRGWIYSRRMIKDAKKRRNLSEAGKKGVEIKRQKEREKSAGLEGKRKGGLQGEGQAHIPEARVQKKRDTDVSPKKTALADGWKPEPFGPDTEAHRILAAMSADERKRQLEAFRDHHRKEGSRFVDWQAAWGTWIRNSERFRQRDERQTLRVNGGSGDYLAHVVERVLPVLDAEEKPR